MVTKSMGFVLAALLGGNKRLLVSILLEPRLAGGDVLSVPGYKKGAWNGDGDGDGDGDATHTLACLVSAESLIFHFHHRQTTPTHRDRK